MRLPWQTLALATAAVVASTGPAVRAALWLPTEGWGAQPWRVLTCHFVHHDPTHLLWDLGGFVVLGVALELRCVRSFTWAVGLGAVVVGVAMGILLPDEGVFGGLSGLDVALFAALAWRLVADGGADRRVGLLMGVALAAKLCWELAADGVLFAGSEGVVHAPMAHLIGALVGLAVGLWTANRGRTRASAPVP